MAKLSIGDAWDEAKRVFSADRQRIVPVALTMLLLPAALMTLLTGAEADGNIRDLPPGGILAVFALLLISVAGNMAIARLALFPDQSVGDALRVAARRMWPLLAAFMLVALPLVLLLSVAMVATGVTPGSAEAAEGNPVLSLLVLILIIVFFYVAVRLSLSNIVAAAEEGGPVQILKRGFELSRGAFWRLCGFLFVLVVAALVVSLVVGLFAGMLVAFGDGAVEPLSLSALFLGLAQGAIQAGLAVTYVLMLVALYRQANAAG